MTKKKIDRKTELLRVVYKLLKRCSESGYVLDIMSETIHYDGADCDGNCLMEDIALELGLD